MSVVDVWFQKKLVELSEGDDIGAEIMVTLLYADFVKFRDKQLVRDYFEEVNRKKLHLVPIV